METLTRAEATAAYREFISVSDEPVEMDFDSWVAFEGIVIA